MKNYNYTIIGIILCIIVGCFTSCKHDVVPIEKIIYVQVKDTITEKNNMERIVELEHKCYVLQDSLNTIRNSIGEDLFVARYKLERIRYYTDIVDKKSSQLKFYKGWIKRVLEE